MERKFSDFFSWLGHGNFVTGTTIGHYGIDWGHHTPEEVEDDVIRSSIEYKEPFILERTERGPEATKTFGLGHGSSVTYLNFGRLGHPNITMANRTLTFKSAEYRDGQFILITEEESVEGKYSLEELWSIIDGQDFSIGITPIR